MEPTEPRELPELPGALGERFEVRALLGTGGFATVVLARDRRLDRDVAIKLCKADLSDRHKDRFRREAEVLASLSHPGIVRIFDHGMLADGPYIVMEHVDGKPLHKADDADPRKIALEVAEALEAVHAAGVLHRDIKPDNVLVTREGATKLVDFGLVTAAGRTRVTKAGSLIGTLGYMSPEILRGGPATRASDWYAFGVTLYLLCESKGPFTRDEILEVAGGEPLPRIKLRKVDPAGAMGRLLTAAISEDPEDRPAGLARVRELLGDEPEEEDEDDALESILRAAASDAHERIPPSERSSERSQATPMRGPWTGLALSLLILMAGLSLMLHTPSPEPTSPAPPDSTAGAAPGGAALERLRKTIDDLAPPHRTRKGEYRITGREGPLAAHLPELLEDIQDARFPLRWGRFLEAMLEALRVVASGEAGEELEGFMLQGAMPFLRHLASDVSIAAIRLRIPNAFAPTARLPSRGTSLREERDLLSARLTEVTNVARKTVEELHELPEVPLVTAAQAMVASFVVGDLDGKIAARVRRSQLLARSTSERYWNLAGGLLIMPGILVTRAEYPCDDRIALLSWLDAEVVDASPDLTATERAGLESSLAYRHAHFLFECSPEGAVKAQQIRRLDRALDSCGEGVVAAPVKIQYELEKVILLETVGVIQAGMNDAFEGRTARLHELVAEASRVAATR